MNEHSLIYQNSLCYVKTVLYVKLHEKQEQAIDMGSREHEEHEEKSKKFSLHGLHPRVDGPSAVVLRGDRLSITSLC
jgi:hypothetical protein